MTSSFMWQIEAKPKITGVNKRITVTYSEEMEKIRKIETVCNSVPVTDVLKVLSRGEAAWLPS